MPQPHEQKLQEVVNSCTWESFSSRAATVTAVQSSSPPPAVNLNLNASLRLIRALPESVIGRLPRPGGSRAHLFPRPTKHMPYLRCGVACEPRIGTHWRAPGRRIAAIRKERPVHRG